MEDLTQEDLNNLGEWISEDEKYPYIELGKFKLIMSADNNGYFFYITRVGSDIDIVEPFQAPTKEHLSRMCFFCEGKHLDFEPKKDYSWGGFILNMLSSDSANFRLIIRHVRDVSACTGEQKLSIVAELKLMIILAEINKDFPGTGSKTFFPVAHKDGTIQFEMKLNGEKVNNLGCDSKDGFEMLVKTNTSLLADYFGIKTETT